MMAWQVQEEMPVEEFYTWLAWMEYKSEMEKKAAEKAKKGRKK